MMQGGAANGPSHNLVTPTAQPHRLGQQLGMHPTPATSHSHIDYPLRYQTCASQRESHIVVSP